MIESDLDTHPQDVFLNYIHNNILSTTQALHSPNTQQSAKKLQQQIDLFLIMRHHYLNALSDFQTKNKPIDPAQDGNPHPLPNLYSLLSQILVFASLTNDQTLLKHQMISLNQTMFAEFINIKNIISQPLTKFQEQEQITMDEAIKRVELDLRQILTNASIASYFKELKGVKNKSLTECKQEVVIEENQSEEEKDDKEPILKINNSSSQSQKANKLLAPNYEGDQQVFTGESDHKIAQKKHIKKLFVKKKNIKKKYVQQQNYYASQQQQKHKKNKAFHWRHHTQQGFDTDKQKEKMTDDKK